MAKTKLSQADETVFRAFYSAVARRNGLNPNPDDPRHFYDYRAAFKAGAVPDSTGHWPSQFKLPGHPRTYQNPNGSFSANPTPGAVDTRTGRRIPARKKP